MNSTRRFPWIALALAIPLSLAGQTATGGSPTEAAGAFDRFKALEGRWQGHNSHGDAVQVSYEVTAAGSAVLERLGTPEAEMITLYYLEDDRLQLTHYCVAGNRPRMRAESIEADEVRFDLVGDSPLNGAGEGHMRSALFRFVDAERLESHWTYRDGGKDVFTEAIRLRRVTPSAEQR